MELEPKPVVVILGQTASGKSALALKMAAKYAGDILAADSRTIYKGMDIGTAKPSAQDRQAIPHYGLDLVTPDQTFSAAEFKEYAKNVVTKTHAEGRVPLIVGGTGLYIDGYVYDFEFAGEADPALRQELESLDLNELQERASQLGIDETDSSWLNSRHLARAIERGGVNTNRKPKPKNVLIVGLKVSKEELDERIKTRVDTMFAGGLVQEVQNLINTYGEDAPGLLAPGYKEVKEHIKSGLSLDETKEQVARGHRRLAKRQNTWFKRNPDIVWCENEHQAEQKIRAFLSKFATIDS